MFESAWGFQKCEYQREECYMKSNYKSPYEKVDFVLELRQVNIAQQSHFRPSDIFKVNSTPFKCVVTVKLPFEYAW